MPPPGGVGRSALAKGTLLKFYVEHHVSKADGQK